MSLHIAGNINRTYWRQQWQLQREANIRTQKSQSCSSHCGSGICADDLRSKQAVNRNTAALEVMDRDHLDLARGCHSVLGMYSAAACEPRLSQCRCVSKNWFNHFFFVKQQNNYTTQSNNAKQQTKAAIPHTTERQREATTLPSDGIKAEYVHATQQRRSVPTSTPPAATTAIL